jgi:hypothetical protein
MANKLLPVTMEIVTDPVVLAAARVRNERFGRNLDWFQAHADEIGRTCRGKCICIAGQELFVADTSPEAFALAQAAHPDDDGFFIHYIPRERLARIYAPPRCLAPQ